MKFNLSLVILLAWAISASAITIETVPIGDVGNPDDPATGSLYGRVDYAYNIGKYEVTIGQYVAFLNAVAASDPYDLFTLSMPSDLNSAGIMRLGVPGSYTYSAIGSANHPVAHVSWGDAARFANWLHNGQPTGAEGPGTTETGAYTLDGATREETLVTIVRNPGAKWFVPSENEWYKAAYYQPVAQGGDVDGYWAYPMRTNSTPYSDQPSGNPPDLTRVGNFYKDDFSDNGYDDGYAVTGTSGWSSSQNYLTDVGVYSWAANYYGTFDQGGNVFEWNDAVSTDVHTVFYGRGMRGGGWQPDRNDISASFRMFINARTGENGQFGFRIASAVVPEPSTIALAVGAITSLVLHRRKPTCHDCA